ncbi:MAG: hypothetical protein P1V20_25975 [Verrucomicrobiales bacterium]|nr:hypothetical protein [Verrucomicrobiales bacterium]
MDKDYSGGHQNLPRLHQSAYQGLATVHWVFTIKDRKTGWLNDQFFLNFQLATLHTFSRFSLASPAICLMPDHIHLLVMGVSESSDQRKAIPFLRTHLIAHLDPFEFQKVPYDHVLRKDERKRDAFATMAGYILANPYRAGLLDSDKENWHFECSIVPGYPDMEIREEKFWDRYWKIYYRLIEKNAA